MRLVVAVATLALSACSAGTPSTYQQAAAPMAPAFAPPAATPAGTGLYRPNAPTGTSSPAVSPTPHKRYLPPTKEPGLWSGDVRAMAGGPLLLGFEMPFPVDAHSDMDKRVTRICAEEMARLATIFFQSEIPWVADLTKAQRRCTAATLFRECVAEWAKAYASAEDTETIREDERLEQDFKRTQKAADAYFEDACTGLTFDTFQEGAVDGVALKWRNALDTVGIPLTEPVR